MVHWNRLYSKRDEITITFEEMAQASHTSVRPGLTALFTRMLVSRCKRSTVQILSRFLQEIDVQSRKADPGRDVRPTDLKSGYVMTAYAPTVSGVVVEKDSQKTRYNVEENFTEYFL